MNSRILWLLAVLALASLMLSVAVEVQTIRLLITNEHRPPPFTPDDPLPRRPVRFPRNSEGVIYLPTAIPGGLLDGDLAKCIRRTSIFYIENQKRRLIKDWKTYSRLNKLPKIISCEELDSIPDGPLME